jgi:hypothetical protein
LLGRYFTTWVTSPAIFYLVYTGDSIWNFAQVSLNCNTPILHLLLSLSWQKHGTTSSFFHWDRDSQTFARSALKHNHPDLSLLHSYYYRCEPLVPGWL